MYSILVERTKQLRSIHQETKAGLDRAIRECDMRTHGTNTPHIVVDQHGLKLHTSLPHEVAKKLEVKREERHTTWAIMGIVAAIIIAALWLR